MIESFFALMFCNALYIIGLHNAAKFEYVSEDLKEAGIIENSKMILWRLRLFCLKHFGKFYSKGLITCPPCMALTHSTYIYFLVVYFGLGFIPLSSLIVYPLYVGALSGVVLIGVKLIELIEAITDKMYNS